MITAIKEALRAFRLSAEDIQSIEKTEGLKGKVYLKRGKGALFFEGWTEEIRRKKQLDGSYSFFRLQLPRPAYRVKWNDGSWIRLGEV